jgi:hypothetical protein
MAALLGLVLVGGGLLAEEIKGKVKSVDADKKVLTVTVDGKDKEFKLNDSTTFVGPKGKALKEGIKAKGLKEGANVTITTDKKDGKVVVTEVKLSGGKKNKDK